jgi:putative membrane protein
MQPSSDSSEEQRKNLANDERKLDNLAHDEAPTYNLANELAKERTRAASDRTLMAWIRTSLSLIGFGFGLPTILKAIESTRVGDHLEHLNPHRFSSIVGLAFIAVGVFAITAALQEHRRMVKRIEREHYVYKGSATAEIVSISLLLIGVMSFLAVLIRSINL